MSDSRALTPSTQVLNPVEIEQIIRRVSNEIAMGVQIVSARLAAYRKIETEHAHVFAQAYMDHDGPQTEKRQAAELAAHELRLKRDEAEVTYKHAQAAMSALEKELTAWQSVNKTVTTMYGAAGHAGYGS